MFIIDAWLRHGSSCVSSCSLDIFGVEEIIEEILVLCLESLYDHLICAHNLLIRETSGIRIKNNNNNEHVTRKSPAHVLDSMLHA